MYIKSPSLTNSLLFTDGNAVLERSSIPIKSEVSSTAIPDSSAIYRWVPEWLRLLV